MSYIKKLAVFNCVAFIGTILINTLANLIPFNGLTTGELSALYPNLFVPAGITFSIWGVIYSLLGIFTAYQLIVAFKTKDSVVTFIHKIGYWNILLGVGNMLWVILWHYRYVGASVIIMVLMLISLIFIYNNLSIGRAAASKKEVFLVHINFSVYLGWISVATIANVTAFLVSINWQGFGIPEAIWTVILMVVSLALGLYFLHMRRDIFYSAVIAWAFIGIYLKRTAAGTEAVRSVITMSIIGISVLAILIILALLRKRAYIFTDVLPSSRK
ncbi:hypothetical protein F8154_05410 [Alkaliphilus pronyensis]|uniref:Tryptophan-rich sensory protein n=1 Tax=Alkaliphilus pronyensis TaxID=1482732 RepID=A0A6I0F0D0_9FIRM|nr:hypothetical protein [Alkaliphilus pronyensis]KAB3535738.1 hypothetical protein F8154_05410 [Alkaliphilus pronyensis]